MHSSLRWTIPSGTKCSAGTLLAYCNLAPAFGLDPALTPLASEWQDLQLAFVLEHPGEVYYKRDTMGGGQTDRNVCRFKLDPEREFGRLKTAKSPRGPIVRLSLIHI